MAEQDDTLPKWYEKPPDDPRFPGIACRQGGSGSWRPVLWETAVHVQTIAIANLIWAETSAEIAENDEQPVARVNEALGFFYAYQE